MLRSSRSRLQLTNLEDRTLPSGIPILDAWLKSSQGEFARVISGNNLAAGPTTTWNSPPAGGTNGGNATPTLGDTSKISSSANSVYVQAPDFSSSVMGPWYLNAGGTLFPNFPSNQNRIYRITRNPIAATTTHTATQLGAIGLGVNGVSYFNMSDGMSYSTTTQTVSGKGSGFWNRDAFVGEAVTFDHAHAHQPQSGEYHYHISPTALRAQLRDNITYHGTSATFPTDPNVIITAPEPGETHLYSEFTSERHHSPILGYAADGFPIYGPYGYNDGTNAGSAIVQNTSSYRFRNITVRQSLPGFAAKAKFGDSVSLNAVGEYTLTAANYGPAVNATYPLGTFIEDYEYAPGLGTLDMYNGRFTKTPEYPSGIYAYFTTLDPDDGDDVFPYSVGRQYYGVVNGGAIGSITETVSTHFDVTSPQNGGSVRGVVYFDLNGNAARDETELGYSTTTVYLDANGNNTFDSGETSAATGIDGGYELPVAFSGPATVRIFVPPGYAQTSPQPAAVIVTAGNAVFGVTVGIRVLPPTVSMSQIDDGSAQRSIVKMAAITFSEAVTTPNGLAAAFTFNRVGGGNVAFAAQQTGNVVTLTAANGGGVALDPGGSLPDGRYLVSVVAANVSGAGGALDGNGNGVGGDDSNVSFHRLFGDSNGDATVDGVDFAAFGTAFGQTITNSSFDWNSDQTIDGVDFAEFGGRFGLTI